MRDEEVSDRNEMWIFVSEVLIVSGFWGKFGWKMRRRSLYPWKHAFRKAQIHLCLANRYWHIFGQGLESQTPNGVYVHQHKVVNPAGWRDDNHPECDNNVAYREYKCMGPGSSTYHKRNLSKELTDEQVKPFISPGYIQVQVHTNSVSTRKIVDYSTSIYIIFGFNYKIL